MIHEIQFKNFKVLRDTALPLSRFTLIVGPNGSGKSTALNAIPLAGKPSDSNYKFVATQNCGESVEVVVRWEPDGSIERTTATWAQPPSDDVSLKAYDREGREFSSNSSTEFRDKLQVLRTSRIYSLDPTAILEPVRLESFIQLKSDGRGLAGVLDRLRDHEPERFEALNRELQRWIPEFDRVLFDVPMDGHRSFSLRTVSGFEIAANDLSDGTLMALGLLAIAFHPDTPRVVAIEEPDHGVHPRLLRNIQDALYRLAYPENYDEDREPIQVIATTHSPYLLDLLKDHPEEVVIAEKQGAEATFQRLADRADIDQILEDASLGEIWYSGLLGGVPAGT